MFLFALSFSRTLTKTFSPRLAVTANRKSRRTLPTFNQLIEYRKGLIATTLVVLTCSSPSGQMLSGSPSQDLANLSSEALVVVSADSMGKVSMGRSAVDPETRRQALRHLQLGWGLLTSFDWSAAQQEFVLGTSLDPTLVVAHVGIAKAYLGMEIPQQALEHSHHALQLTEGASDKERLWAELTDLQVRAALAWQQGSRGHHPQLLRAIEDAILRYPADPALYVLRGQVDARLMGNGEGGDEGTVLWYRKALELDPNDAAAHHHLVYLLQSRGRLRAARHHAERYSQLMVEPQSSQLLAHILLLQGEPRAASRRLLVADQRHREYLGQTSRGWGATAEFSQHLHLLIAVEEGLGAQAAAEEHAEELFALESRGRLAGHNCLPLLEQLQQRGQERETLIAARRCEAKASLLARVVGAAYRGEAQLALGRLVEARRALVDAGEAHATLVADLAADPTEKQYAQAAQLSINQLRGKLDLLLGDHRAGEQRLLDIAHRLADQKTLESWLTGRQRLREISAVADRAGRFSLSITSARALEKLTPEGLIAPATHYEEPSRWTAAQSLSSVGSSWVVWKER